MKLMLIKSNQNLVELIDKIAVDNRFSESTTTMHSNLIKKRYQALSNE